MAIQSAGQGCREYQDPFPVSWNRKSYLESGFTFYQTDNQQASGAIARFVVDHMDATQRESSIAGVETGTAVFCRSTHPMDKEENAKASLAKTRKRLIIDVG